LPGLERPEGNKAELESKSSCRSKAREAKIKLGQNTMRRKNARKKIKGKDGSALKSRNGKTKHKKKKKKGQRKLG